MTLQTENGFYLFLGNKIVVICDCGFVKPVRFSEHHLDILFEHACKHPHLHPPYDIATSVAVKHNTEFKIIITLTRTFSVELSFQFAKVLNEKKTWKLLLYIYIYTQSLLSMGWASNTCHCSARGELTVQVHIKSSQCGIVSAISTNIVQIRLDPISGT